MQDDKEQLLMKQVVMGIRVERSNRSENIKECISGRNYWGILLLQNVEGTPDGRCDTSSPLCKDWERLQCPDGVLYICVSVITPLNKLASYSFMNEGPQMIGLGSCDCPWHVGHSEEMELNVLNFAGQSRRVRI